MSQLFGTVETTVLQSAGTFSSGARLTHLLRHLALIVLATTRVAYSAEASGPSDTTPQVIRGVPYTTHGRQTLRADIYLPSGADGPFPAVLMVHGGAWMSGSRTHVAPHALYAVKRGYAVVAIDYRLAPKHKFPAQLEDCREAVRWVCRNADQYRIDAQRLAGYGYSAGGHLVCLLAVAGVHEAAGKPAIHRLQAVVAGGAPCDFREIPEDSEALAYWLGGSRKEKSATYRFASPAALVTPDDSPIFFFHGDRDRLVPVASPRGMQSRLERAGVKTQLHRVPGAGHLGAFMDEESRRLSSRFLRRGVESRGQPKCCWRLVAMTGR